MEKIRNEIIISNDLQIFIEEKKKEKEKKKQNTNNTARTGRALTTSVSSGGVYCVCFLDEAPGRS